MLIADDGRPAADIEVVAEPALAAWQAAQDDVARAWLAAAEFGAGAGEVVQLPDAAGQPRRLVAGLGEQATLASLGAVAAKLPAADYRLANAGAEEQRLALGWALGGYRFDAYKSTPRPMPRLLVKDSSVLDEWCAVALCRDLINTPAAAMLPHDLEAAVRTVAVRHGATVAVVEGDALLRGRLEAIHTVGRASASAPRLIDLRWGEPDRPKVTLVGKGVCFDSGGLDLKPASNMRLMKKDMGGAAHVLALAQLVMARALPVCLRVLVPAVENAVAGNAFRPGDVIRTYAGHTVEVGNTDAEGRLVLADALALAAEEEPALMVDFATLTGAARVALGPDLPAMFGNDDESAQGVFDAGARVEDPVWRLPLFAPYGRWLKSEVADLANVPGAAEGGYGGAIAAALFLERFVGGAPWLHFDIMAWNTATRPAHPVGGEAMGLRAVFAFLADRFG